MKLKLFVVAGEDSGDLHGSNLIQALKEKVVPSLVESSQEDPIASNEGGILSSQSHYITTKGVGGDKLAERGMELIAHVKDINFMGFWEIIKNLGTIRKLFKRVHEEIEAFEPDAVILIDYPGFNLRLAKQLHKKGIKVFYYISPQVWAWKKGRVKQIQRFVDKMYVILPFEKSFYADEGVEVEFVGHPLLDVVPPRALNTASGNTIALLPGSRKQEIIRMLPEMLKLVERFPDYRFVIAGAPSQEEGFYQEYIKDSRVELWMNRTYELLQQAAYACVTSGTATLETALFGVPQVVAYKGSRLSYEIGKRLVQVPFISLVNLIMEREVVEELIQTDFHTDNLERALRDLMQPEKHRRVQEEYARLRQVLGSEGASDRTAAHIYSELSISA